MHVRPRVRAGACVLVCVQGESRMYLIAPKGSRKTPTVYTPAVQKKNSNAVSTPLAGLEVHKT